MNENVKVIFGLIGGLALFLYGMNSMSDALQKAAGEKMKRFWDSYEEPGHGSACRSTGHRKLWAV